MSKERSLESATAETESEVIRKKHKFGVLSLVFGIVALGCAIIPMVALDQPMPFFGEDERRAEEERAKAEGEAKFSFKINDTTFSFGKKKAEEEAPAEGEQAEAEPTEPDDQPMTPADKRRMAKWFTVGAIGLALVGLTFAPFAYLREDHKALAISSTGLCCAAIAWQYILIGIGIGVALAILILILHAFSFG